MRWTHYVLLFLVLFPSFARSEVRPFRASDLREMTWSLPYTFGTHRGTISTVDVKANLDLDKWELESLDLRIPLQALQTKNPEMQCHMRESLGLDYTKSHFPKSHVCTSKHELPASGDDSIAFGEIVFNASKPQVLTGASKMDVGGSTEIQIDGIWTLHGVSKPDKVTAVLSLIDVDPVKLRIEGEKSFSLKDFGVVVKRFFIVKVDDKVHAKFDFILTP